MFVYRQPRGDVVRSGHDWICEIAEFSVVKLILSVVEAELKIHRVVNRRVVLNSYAQSDVFTRMSMQQGRKIDDRQRFINGKRDAPPSP